MSSTLGIDIFAIGMGVSGVKTATLDDETELNSTFQVLYYLLKSVTTVKTKYADKVDLSKFMATL